MIVYNVKRRFFETKAEAEAYRIAEGLPPSATAKITITDRKALAALLTELCEPATGGVRPAAAATGVTTAVVDRAFVEIGKDIPAFLRDSWRRLMGDMPLVDEARP